MTSDSNLEAGSARMSRLPTFSPSTMDFIGQLERQENGLPENQRREFELAVEMELEDVLEAFNAEYENASKFPSNGECSNNK